jgi:hypothetical protein
MHREYSVGYKKPPSEYQFKTGNSAARHKASKKGELPDLARHLDRWTDGGGKLLKMSPIEVAMLSLAREALKGKSSAIKKAFQVFEEAGLLEPPPGKQSHGVLVAPKDLHPHFFCVLLKVLGVPPWDPKLSQAALAEYQQDKAQIAELRHQFLKGRNHG